MDNNELVMTSLYSRQDLMSNLNGLKNIKGMVIIGIGFIAHHLAIKMAMMGVRKLILVSHNNQCIKDYYCLEDTFLPANILGCPSNSIYQTANFIKERRAVKATIFEGNLRNKDWEASVNISSVKISDFDTYKQNYESFESEGIELEIIEPSAFIERIDEFKEYLTINALENYSQFNFATEFKNVLKYIDYEVSFIQDDKEGFKVVRNPYYRKRSFSKENIVSKRYERNPSILLSLLCCHIFTHYDSESKEKEEYIITLDNLFINFFSNANLISYMGDEVDTGVSYSLEDFENFEVEEL